MQLSLEINKRCNFACSFCYTNKVGESLPPIEKVLQTIDEVSRQGVDSLSLTGGEPLIQFDRVRKICRKAKQYGIKVRLNTNGSLIDGAAAQELSELVDEFQVSMNAVDSKSFSDYTSTSPQKNFFERVLLGCQHLLDQGCNVSIRVTYTCDLSNSINKLFNFLLNISSSDGRSKLRKIKVRTFVPAGGLTDNNKPELMLAPLRAAICAALEDSSVQIEYKDGSGAMPLSFPSRRFSTSSCICGESSLHVSCDLKRVVPCVFLRDSDEFLLGDASIVGLDVPRLLNSPVATRFRQTDTTSQVGCRGHAACQI